MKQLLVRKGQVVVADVPAPTVGARNLLVRVRHSCVSIGTEISGVKLTALPVWKRALKQPHHARRVLQLIKDQGLARTVSRVTGMLNAGMPTGYSAAGRVLAVGDQVDGIAAGDLVACAGAGIANHAEFIDVPVNLAVRLPAGLGTDEAATVTLGAIALQGVRRAAPTLGETFVVVGLGVLGQITQQLLRAAGVRVIGTDVDPTRIELARSLGMIHGVGASDPDVAGQVRRLTGGLGADAVIITAAASGNNEIIAEAMRCCRRKGRVVIVGDVGLALQRHEFYAKELDVLISCSYGPGRYDPVYEEQGQDYPAAYVRWTENRNMEEYLRLLAEKRVQLAPLAPETYELARAPEAYAALQNPGRKPLLVLLAYPVDGPDPVRSVKLGADSAKKEGRIGVACVGAGGFAQMMHLPNVLKHRGEFDLRTICSRTGSNAVSAAKQFGASRATTDFAEVLRDSEVDLVILCTRHDLHGRMTLEALRAGKHVLCEKPLGLNHEELDAIEEFLADGVPAKPLLMVGFNRRWSPAFAAVRAALRGRSGPLVAQYTMNAGYIPLDHWVHGPEGGGRNVGEACHIYDLFHALTGAACTDVKMTGIPAQGRQWARNDNFCATLEFADGSVCTLTYTAMGAKAYPKERLQVFCDGKVVVLDDYKTVEVHGGRGGWKGMSQDKGQEAELVALAGFIRNGAPAGFVAEEIAVSRLALEAEGRLMIREGDPFA
ncbi:MAG TPA: bi-domain-containing oxidoreductase [Candidatus Didemnitutus sp.]|nr:bi-domain-containing oxidoreductase [Candidatus Didemnitutus sp.]